MMLRPANILTGPALARRFFRTCSRHFAQALTLSFVASCAVQGDHHGEGAIEHPYHVSVLVADVIEEDHSASSVGLDLELRLNQVLGVSAIVEHAFSPIDGTLVLAAADLHITDHFVVQTGPGVDFVDSEAEAAFRIGTLYEFERGGYTISPQIHYDWTSGEDSVVVGVAMGVGF